MAVFNIKYTTVDVKSHDERAIMRNLLKIKPICLFFIALILFGCGFA